MTIAKLLGTGAIVLGMAAPFAGSPYLSKQESTGQESPEQKRAGQESIDSLQLAQWVRERRSRLRIIDVRRPEEFADYAIPTAENISLDSLPRASFAPDEILVLYSEDGADAAKAWTVLRSGQAQVHLIRGGLTSWYQDVMSPSLCTDANSEQRAAFERTAELSHYFGGVPQLSTTSCKEKSPTANEKAPRFASIRRRGC